MEPVKESRHLADSQVKEDREDRLSAVDDSLDDILDSALNDFDRPRARPKIGEVNSCGGGRGNNVDVEQNLLHLLEKASLGGQNPDDDGGAGGPGQLEAELVNLGRLSRGGAPENSAAAQSALHDALLKMSKDSEQLGAMPTEEEMNQLFDGLGQDKLEQGINNLMPMMEGMMQSLLSKELLYPAMKDMNHKFPDWLADNRPRLSETDFQKYNRQFQLTTNICQEFEAETAKSGEADKKARFERVMLLMQEMQDLGQPPKEVVGNEAAAPNLPPQCPIS